MTNVRELRPLNLTDEQRRDVIAILDRMWHTLDDIDHKLDGVKARVSEAQRPNLRVLPGGAA